MPLIQNVKAVRLCSQTITQAHARPSTANDNTSCTQSAGIAARSATDHRRCYHVPDGLPYPLVMRVSQYLECGSHAAAPAVLAITWRSWRFPRSSAPSGITCQGRYRCRPPLPVARRLACGSHAAAPAILTIRRVAYRYPSWSRRC